MYALYPGAFIRQMRLLRQACSENGLLGKSLLKKLIQKGRNMELVQMELPPEVEKIIKRLNSSGFEAYAVGGCVRDSLLGRIPDDWDITTPAQPKQVKELFHRTIDTGIQHGTVTVMAGSGQYEVTTYRIDGEYPDGRHPAQVSFTSELLEDLKRRDFTINAMAYSHETGIVDAFDGMKDLRAGRIRCVGNPLERFEEDALRILRAIRFSAQLGFIIEEKTYEAISQIAPRIALVSKERIQAELTKILCSQHPEKIREVFATGIHKYISPAFAGLPWKEVRISSDLSSEKYIRWAAFLGQSGPETAVEVLKALKMDNDTIRKVQTLAAWTGRHLNVQESEVRRGMSAMPPEVWDALIQLNGYGCEIQALTNQIRSRGDCLDLKHLAVSGQDLAAAGIPAGKEMGRLLNLLLDLVLEDPNKNHKDILLEIAKNLAI